MKKNKIIIIVIILIGLIAFFCFKYKSPIIVIDIDNVKKIFIVYKPIESLRKKDLKITIDDRDNQKLLIDNLEKSILYISIGEKLSMITEGGYEIIIEFNNSDKIIYEVSYENILTDRKKNIPYINDFILNELRSFLFGKLIDEEIRLE